MHDTNGHTKRLLSSGAWYLFATGASLASGLAVLPIVLNSLTAVDYGIYASLEVFSAIIGAMTTSGVDVYVTKAFPEAKNFGDEGNVAGTALLVATVTTIASLSLVYAGLVVMRSGFYGAHSVNSRDILTALFIVLAQRTTIHALNVVRMGRRTGVYVCSRASASILQVIAVVSLWSTTRLTLSSLLTASAFSSFVGGLIALLFGYPWNKVRIKNKNFQEILKIGLPVLPSSMMGVLGSQVDRLLMIQLGGLESFAIYAVATKIASLVSVLTDALKQVFVPEVFDTIHSTKVSEMQKPTIVSRTTRVYLLPIATLVVSIFLFLPLVDKWLLPQSYSGYFSYLVPLVLAGVVGVVPAYFGFGIVLTGKTRVLPIISGVTLMVTILSLGAIGNFGTIAYLPWARFLSACVTGGLYVWASRRCFKWNYDYKAFAVLTVGSTTALLMRGLSGNALPLGPMGVILVSAAGWVFIMAWLIFVTFETKTVL